MLLSKITRIILISGSLITVSGCASFLEIGDPPTDCPGATNGIACTSARDIWLLSNNKNNLQDEIDEQNGVYVKGQNDKSGDNSITSGRYPGGTPAERLAIYQDERLNRDRLPAPEPIAIRQPAKILRIMMNKWEDKSGRLHMPGYTYAEIEKRKWVVGRGATINPARITPLNIRKTSLDDERKMNPRTDNTMGIIQQIPTQTEQ